MRIAVFVDYWNFQLTINEQIAKAKHTKDERFRINWPVVGKELAFAACPVLGVDQSASSYEGCNIYTSFDPSTEEGNKFKKWVANFLNRQAGIHVEIRERRPKALPRCPACHKEITHCPHAECAQAIVATAEKGVDTLIVTDLIRLGLSNTYDVAVLASADADMIPAVDYVQTSGKKVIHAAFPPHGVALSGKCWGHFDVMKLVPRIERPPDTKK